jgi:non-ribosomal peptide synthetase component F
VEGCRPRISTSAIRFSDFARCQREWMEGQEAEKQLKYWRRSLAGVPPLLSLPYDRPRPPFQTYKGEVFRVEFTRDLQDDLLNAARKHQATLFMVCVAAFQVVLFKYSGQKNFCVGTAVANRHWPGTTELIGMLVNNVTLRTYMDDTFTLAEVIHNIQRTAVDAYTNQDVPFDKVVQAVHPLREPSYNPIFQVALSFHDSPVECPPLRDLTLEIESGLSNGSAKFDLSVVVVPIQEHNETCYKFHPEIAWEYNSDLFKPETIQKMARHYFQVLEQMVRDSGQKVSDVQLLSIEEEYRTVKREVA